MDEYIAVLELYGQEETGVNLLGRLPHPVPLSPPHVLARD